MPNDTQTGTVWPSPMEKKFRVHLHMHSCFTQILTGTGSKCFPCNNAFLKWEVQWWSTVSACLRLRDFSAYRTFGAQNRAVLGKLGWLVTLGGPPMIFRKFAWKKPILFSPKDFSISYYFTFCFFILISIHWSKTRAQLSEKKCLTKRKFFWH